MAIEVNRDAMHLLSRRNLAIGLFLVFLALDFCATALGAEQPIQVAIGAKVSPSVLPKKTARPIALRLSSTILNPARINDEPTLEKVAFQFDRHGQISTTGLPTCPVSRLWKINPQAEALPWEPRHFNQPAIDAERVCGEALVGTGKVEAGLSLPDQFSFIASGPLLIFNGPKQHGRPVLNFFVFCQVSETTDFIASSVIETEGDQYGTRIQFEIPQIANGNGQLLGFEAQIGKTWEFRHHKMHLLSADCPSGSISAQGEFTFLNETGTESEITESLTLPCG